MILLFLRLFVAFRKLESQSDYANLIASELADKNDELIRENIRVKVENISLRTRLSRKPGRLKAIPEK